MAIPAVGLAHGDERTAALGAGGTPQSPGLARCLVVQAASSISIIHIFIYIYIFIYFYIEIYINIFKILFSIYCL